MIRRRVGIFEATDEALRLLTVLASNPELEVVGIFDPHPASARERARRVSPAVADEVEAKLSGDADAFLSEGRLDAVVDASGRDAFARRFPTAGERGIQVVTPMTARLLWSYGAPTYDRDERKQELLQALAEIVESVELTIDSTELFERMLEIAIGVTGADGGSLMVRAPDGQDLSVAFAVGIERELWPKIRITVGEGIAGAVARDRRSVVLRGPADTLRFPGARARRDLESAVCVPLVDAGHTYGVLNLFHATRRDAFSDDDVAFLEQLGALDAQIIARAQHHQRLRDRATRYTTAHEVREILAAKAPLADRLEGFCRYCAERGGRGIATLYLSDPGDDSLRLAATSLEGGGYGGEYRVERGRGIDGRAAASGEPVLLREGNGALAYAALPLAALDGECFGLLSLQLGTHCDEPDEALEESALFEMVRALSEGIAAAKHQERSAIRATRLSAINEAGIQMLSAESLADVVRLATSSVALILDAEHVVLRLRDPKTRRFVIRSYFGPADGRQQEQLFRIDKAVSTAALRDGHALLVGDLERDGRFTSEAGHRGDGPRSLMAIPLQEDGEPTGTLAVYDKVAADRFFAGRFDDEDLQIFVRYVSYVERAVAASGLRSEARRVRGVDSETELPNASHVMQRLREEIARAGSRRGALMVATCRIENADEIERVAGDSQRREVMRRAAGALRDALREFDVLGRTGRDELLAVLPEPGGRPADRVYGAARRTADEVAKDEELNRQVRAALSFGYAILREDGDDSETLVDRAREPRIRMI